MEVRGPRGRSGKVYGKTAGSGEPEEVCGRGRGREELVGRRRKGTKDGLRDSVERGRKRVGQLALRGKEASQIRRQLSALHGHIASRYSTGSRIHDDATSVSMRGC